MGIPRLVGHLLPYASSVQFQAVEPSDQEEPKDDSASKKTVIVDGPGMAYHAFYLALARNSDARNAFAAAPSYAEVGDIAIEWLQQFQKYGLNM